MHPFTAFIRTDYRLQATDVRVDLRQSWPIVRRKRNWHYFTILPDAFTATVTNRSDPRADRSRIYSHSMFFIDESVTPINRLFSLHFYY